MNHSLVRPLFSGLLDIVGDIHGEADALQSLLGHLGYANDGRHPAGRRLVFLGDLTDRGPDSPAVVEFVKQLVDSDHAQCVLGNHDLNLLLNHRKHDNHWFFGEEWSLDRSGHRTPAVLADDGIRQTVVDLFKSLPLVLEREDVRVVHACWDDSLVNIARHSSDVLSLYQQYKDQIDADHVTRPELDKIDRGLNHQNRNPVKVLTSGKEQRVEEPFEASGKMRREKRVEWWKVYDGDPFCVFGHYSNYRGKENCSARAFCADFAVAKRWEERKERSFDGRYRGQLAAVRFPEQVVMYDNGDAERISGGESR